MKVLYFKEPFLPGKIENKNLKLETNPQNKH